VSDAIINGLYIVPILAVLILIHEIGHFVAARLIGVKVEEFGIGIPPRLKGWRHKGVVWSLNWIPFGGFVRVLGEDGKSADSGSINTKSAAQRAFFLGAGSLMNFALAFFLMVVVVGAQGVAHSHVYISSVSTGSPAATAGWQVGDRIVEVAGAPVESAADVGDQARAFAGKPLSVVVERDGAQIETSVVPRANPPAGEGPTGVGIQPAVVADASVAEVAPDSAAAKAGLAAGDQLIAVDSQPIDDAYALQSALTAAEGTTIPVTVLRGTETLDLSLAVPALDPDADPLEASGLSIKLEPNFERVPWGSVIPVGIGQAWEQTGTMLSGIRDLLTRRAPLSEIAGPIGMAQITSELVRSSPLPLWVTLAQLAILLSLNLAILNLLPLPALDGGRLLFVIVEVLRGGKKLAPEREGIVHFAGLILLLGLMFIVAFLDIGRIVDGGSFLP
jgi:regulator of sigma E protease